MRNQKLKTVPERTSWKRTSLALSAAIAVGAVCAAPLSVSADIVLKQKELTAQQARMTHGEDLYVELCAVCHGASGTGDGPAVAALRQRPVDLTTLKVANDGEFPRNTLEKAIYGTSRISAHGSYDMPVWGRAFEFTKPDWNSMRRKNFAEQRIEKIVDHIESLQTS